MIFTVLFWKATAERAIKSAAQGAATAWGLATFTAFGEVIPVAQATGLAALSMGVLSVLTSLASAQIGNDGPSLSTETIAAPADTEAVDAGAFPPVVD